MQKGAAAVSHGAPFTRCSGEWRYFDALSAMLSGAVV
jgi:hypothetical protein